MNPVVFQSQQTIMIERLNSADVGPDNGAAFGFERASLAITGSLPVGPLAEGHDLLTHLNLVSVCQIGLE
jgi:hypothetical protein